MECRTVVFYQITINDDGAEAKSSHRDAQQEYRQYYDVHSLSELKRITKWCPAELRALKEAARGVIPKCHFGHCLPTFWVSRVS